MNWKNLLIQMLALVHELSGTDQTGPEKLAKLVDAVAAIIESIDDVAAMLPGGFGVIAKLIVDNPGADGMEKLYLATPIAEMIYQIWRGIHNISGVSGVTAFIHNLENGGV